MQQLVIFLDKLLGLFPQEPVLLIAMFSMLLTGFALYVVLAAVKALANKGGDNE